MKKKNNKIKWIVLAVLLILMALAVAKNFMSKDKGTKVATEKATTHTITETVNANGKIYPNQEVKISADASGEVVELYVKEGDTVRAGQVLARIRPELYESTVEQANAAVNISKSNLASSQADLSRLEAQLSQAKTTFDRSKQLYQSGVISKIEYENAETTYKTAQATINAAKQSINSAKYNVDNSNAGLKQAKENLNKTVIISPISGVVSKLNIEKGERVVGTMQMAGTEMMRIADFGGFEAKVKVGENDILRVQLGDTALVEVDAYLDQKFKGIVVEVANSSMSSLSDATGLSDQTVSNYELKIRLLSESYKELLTKNPIPFRPGMSCSASIQTETVTDALSVPIQCVTTRELADSLKTGADDGFQESVFVIKDGKAYIKKVKSGIQNNKYIQILEGLQAGEEIVSAPYTAISKELKNEDKVQVVAKEKLFEVKK